MNPLPRRLKVGHMTFRVTADRATIDSAAVEHRQALAGFSQGERQVIGIKPGMAADFAADTLLHEVLHMVRLASGVQLDYDDEERLILAMTGPLLQVLRDNPPLVAYLQHPRGT